MTPSFLAKVASGSGKQWIVNPLIQEYDGTNHPPITVSAQEGLTPAVGDTVLILIMCNNLDESIISRFYPPTESNGVIIGVVTTANGFTLKGDYNFIGDISIDGDVSSTGDLEIDGDTMMKGSLTTLGTLTANAINAVSIVVGGIDLSTFIAQYLAHTHPPGSYAVTTAPGAVVGASGTPT